MSWQKKITRLQQAASGLRHGTEPEKAKEQLKNHLLTLDRGMANQDHIVGNYSLGDLTFIPFFLRQQRYGTSIGTDTPHLKAWMDRLLAQPAVRSTP